MYLSKRTLNMYSLIFHLKRYACLVGHAFFYLTVNAALERTIMQSAQILMYCVVLRQNH